MSKDKKSIAKRIFTSLPARAGKLIWLIIFVVILAGIGRYLGSKGTDNTASLKAPDKPIVQPLPWREVDLAVAKALSQARQMTAIFASHEIDKWVNDLMARVDNDYLEWYFSYWTQQILGLEGLWQYGVNSFFENQPTAAEKLTQEIQEEFSKRVLRPQIAELVLERIARETAEYYVTELRKNLDVVPARYKIPHAEWDRYLEGIALTTYGADGNRGTGITLKALTLTTAGGTVLLVGKMKFLIGKLSSKVMAKSAGKAAVTIATKTGAKVAAKGGGKFLGPIIGVGVLVWDVWDHNNTKKENRPLLRQSLVDYFAELKDILLNDTEAGIMVIFNDLEKQVFSALKASGKVAQ
ncbi:MAG: hypothetical protein WBB19_19000 [Desulforhopalus sp.]